MKLPSSEQGFSSHPIVTQMVSSISSMKPKPPYLLLVWLPTAFTQESLWWCSSTDQWCVGKKGWASQQCWLWQLLTPCPPKQWSAFRAWPNSSPCWLHRKNTVGFSGSTCTTADTRWVQAEIDVSSKQCCHMCCKDEWRILAFSVIHT